MKHKVMNNKQNNGFLVFLRIWGSTPNIDAIKE